MSSDLRKLLGDSPSNAQEHFRRVHGGRAAASCIATFGGLAEAAQALFPSRLEQGIFLALAITTSDKGLSAEEVFTVLKKRGNTNMPLR